MIRRCRRWRLIKERSYNGLLQFLRLQVLPIILRAKARIPSILPIGIWLKSLRGHRRRSRNLPLIQALEMQFLQHIKQLLYNHSILINHQIKSIMCCQILHLFQYHQQVAAIAVICDQYYDRLLKSLLNHLRFDNQCTWRAWTTTILRWVNSQRIPL